MDAGDDPPYELAKRQAAAGDPAALAALAEAGHPRACHRLGLLLIDGGDPAAQARGAALLRRAAEAGLAQAQFRFGLLLARGEAGEARDAVQAARWCRAAAEQGLPAAQFNLALLHAAGDGLPADPEQAARWLRLAAARGVAEADGCLALVYRDDQRPRTWDEAETRASVALERTDPAAPKSLRLAEYYVDPCLDLLVNRYRMERDAAEEVVQEFFCELEEPLAKGEHRGRPWKDSLRHRYDPARGPFRALLRRSLVNFARDLARRREAGAAAAPAAADPAATAAALAELHRDQWVALLACWQEAAAADGTAAARAVRALRLDLEQGADRAAIAAALGVGERTAHTALRLGGELLIAWLGERLAAPPARLADALHDGLRLLPGWLQYPSAEKRDRVRLLLTLAARVEGGAQGR